VSRSRAPFRADVSGRLLFPGANLNISAEVLVLTAGWRSAGASSGTSMKLRRQIRRVARSCYSRGVGLKANLSLSSSGGGLFANAPRLIGRLGRFRLAGVHVRAKFDESLQALRFRSRRTRST
jgi:hypothetical protein